MGSSVILPAPGQPREGPDPGFKSGAIPTSATFKFADVAPPSALYVMPDDQLELVAMSSFVGETVIFRVRFLHVVLPIPGQPDTGTPQGLPVLSSVPPYIGIYEFQIPITAARTLTVLRPNLGEGFILSVFASSLGVFTRGQTFARAALFRGTAGGATTHNVVLVSEYVDSNYSVSGPGATIKHYLEGPGQLHSLQQANPAAGADWTLTALAHQRLRIESFSAVFTASATVANRNVELIVDDGANIYWRTSAATSITAGQVVTFNGTTTNAPAGVVTTDQSVVFPPTLALPPGHRLRVATTGIQAGDQWSAIWFGVEEWLDF